MTILIIGLPGSGKTTWARKNMGDGLCYDFDALSAAFRLSAPKTNDTRASRGTANDLLSHFCRAASLRCNRLLIIRAAPQLAEARILNPDRVVYCRSDYWPEIETSELRGMQRRIEDAISWAAENGVPIEYSIVSESDTGSLQEEDA